MVKFVWMENCMLIEMKTSYKVCSQRNKKSKRHKNDILILRYLGFNKTRIYLDNGFIKYHTKQKYRFQYSINFLSLYDT